MLENENDLYLCFGIGSVVTITHEDINNIYLWLLLPEINKIISDSKYQNIYLFGHSNGMACSILVTYCILCLFHHDLFKHLYEKFNIEEISIEFLDNISQYYVNIIPKLNLCLSGGFPVLFETEDDYIKFYNILNGRIILLAQSLVFANENLIDGFLIKDDQNKKCYNYKMALYNTSSVDKVLKICFIDYFNTDQLIELKNQGDDDDYDRYYNENKIYTYEFNKKQFKCMLSGVVNKFIHDFSNYRNILTLLLPSK